MFKNVSFFRSFKVCDSSRVWKIVGFGRMTVSYKFSVSSAYNILRELCERECSSLFASFWKIKALPSAFFTAWRVLGNKIASKANLVRRGIEVGNMSYCMCGEEEETTRHLFFECRVAWLVWNLCYD